MPKEVVDAKARLGHDTAVKLARAASAVIVVRGKKVVRFDMIEDPPGDEALLACMLGPTGNLRAPTIRSGKTLVVGFHAEIYTDELT